MAVGALVAVVTAVTAAVVVNITSSRPGRARVEAAVAPTPALPTAAVAGHVHYRGIGARIRTTLTAEERAAPRVGSAAAIAEFQRSGIRPDLMSEPRTVALSVFSDDTLGTKGSDGITVPFYQQRLAWVVTVPDAPVELYGPPGAPTSLDLGCDYVFVVDALTGTPLTAFQGCNKE